MPKCYAETITLEHGIQAVRLVNPQVEVTVLPDKGADIYALVHRASGVDVLWKSPLGLRAPNQGRFAPDSATAWLEMYEGGWQECIPNGGDAGVYKGVELSFHGESTLSPWAFEVVTESDAEVIVDFSVMLYRTPFRIQRRMTLKADTATLQLSEQVDNLAGEPLDFMWGHHPAYGAPFLSEHTRLHTNAKTILADDNYDSPSNVLQPGAKSTWPLAAGKNGKTVDLSVIPGQTDKRDTLAYLLDFDGTPWYALTNEYLKMGVGCTWSANAFRCLWLWQEIYASAGFPFYSRTYTMAVEPWSSWPGRGLLHLLETTRTHHTLEPGATLTGDLTMTLFTLDNSRRITRVEADGTVQYE